MVLLPELSGDGNLAKCDPAVVGRNLMRPIDMESSAVEPRSETSAEVAILKASASQRNLFDTGTLGDRARSLD